MVERGDIRLGVDVGGTFTDLIVERASRHEPFSLYKSLTTPDDPLDGVFDVLGLAAADLGMSLRGLLEASWLFVHGTTRATNAILTDSVARTALLVTEGHPDILLWREGTRIGTFDFTVEYPDLYISRALTFEIPERIGVRGEVVKPLDEGAVVRTIRKLEARGVEAVAVAFLWSVVNGVHEERVGELLGQHLPGVPVTLSHELSQTVREYRRASAAAIDASLKPLMAAYINTLGSRLTNAGFRGRALVMTSSGGLLDTGDVASAPILTIASGPAAAPVAGRTYASLDADSETAIITDAGGTSYDVSLVLDGRIPRTRETRLGRSHYGHMTGFPSVDIKSIGSGGGSIAYVDRGGILHVGPRSAGSTPGPVCYGRGGNEPTVTDAGVVLGYLDPQYFLGGRIALDADAARDALQEKVADRLNMGLYQAAAAIFELATENMVGAIEEITLSQGLDPRKATIVAGGGSGGFNVCAIARRLNIESVVVPRPAAALSAMGSLLSDVSTEFSITAPTTVRKFDFKTANASLEELIRRCHAFADGPGSGSHQTTILLSVEARYTDQVWEIEVAMPGERFESEADVEAFREEFDATHERLFTFRDAGSDVEIITWWARVSCSLPKVDLTPPRVHEQLSSARSDRSVYFAQTGFAPVSVYQLENLGAGEVIEGPCIVESAVTTVVMEPGSKAHRRVSGSLFINPGSNRP